MDRCKQEKRQEPVDFLLYFGEEESYAEADEEPLFRDAKGKLVEYRKNLYRCMPFTHVYSGWGMETQGLDPALLAYSRIRMIRDLIQESSSVRSDMMFNFHSFAHKSKTLFVRAGGEVAAEWRAAVNNDPDKFNIIYLPEGSTPDDFQTDESLLFGPEAYAYADRINADLAAEFPAPLVGQSGTSGRHQDLGRSAALAIYNCAKAAVAHAWELSIRTAFKVMATKGLDLMPKGVSEDDLKRFEDITVDLSSEDPVERDRQINMGSTEVHEGLKSLHTFLVEDRRLTEDEADKEEIRIMADKYIAGSPDFAAFIGFMAAQKAGMAEELKAFQAQAGQAGAGNVLTSNTGTQGGPQRQGDIQTEIGREQADVGATSTGQRTPPQV